jgi:hypothetical protein
MVPDVALVWFDDGVQLEPQFVPPHVRVARGSPMYPRLHVPVKPLRTVLPSDVKAILRKPVVEV